MRLLIDKIRYIRKRPQRAYFGYVWHMVTWGAPDRILGTIAKTHQSACFDVVEFLRAFWHISHEPSSSFDTFGHFRLNIFLLFHMCYQLSHIFSNNTYFSIKFRTDRSESLRTSFESAADGELGEFLMNFFSCLEVGHTSTSNRLPMVIAKVLADPSERPTALMK